MMDGNATPIPQRGTIRSSSAPGNAASGWNRSGATIESRASCRAAFPRLEHPMTDRASVPQEPRDPSVCQVERRGRGGSAIEGEHRGERNSRRRAARRTSSVRDPGYWEHAPSTAVCKAGTTTSSETTPPQPRMLPRTPGLARRWTRVGAAYCIRLRRDLTRFTRLMIFSALRTLARSTVWNLFSSISF